MKVVMQTSWGAVRSGPVRSIRAFIKTTCVRGPGERHLPGLARSVDSSDHARAYFESRSKQSTNLASISASNLMEMPLLQPTEAEQSAIVEAVHRRTREIDAVRSATQRTVELLRERRAALITAAVTGQIDMEGAA